MPNKLYQIVGESKEEKIAVDLETMNLHSQGTVDFAEGFINELKQSDIGGDKKDITNIVSVVHAYDHGTDPRIHFERIRPLGDKEVPLVVSPPTSGTIFTEKYGRPIEELRKEFEEFLSPAKIRQTGKTFSTLDSISTFADELKAVDEIPPLVKPTSYLTTKPSKVRIILEDTKFQPSPTVMMAGKNFAEAYKQQLTKIIYGEQSEKNAEVLISFTSVFNLVYKGKDPVQLRSTKLSRKLNDIIKTLNDFFRTHNHVLTSIVGMVHSEVANNEVAEPRIPARDGMYAEPEKVIPKSQEKLPPESDDFFEH